MSKNSFDKPLLEKFEQEIWSKNPHLEEGKVVNATPLIDLTNDFKECAKNIYKLDISDLDLKVYGKFDGELVSGSIKIRPAIHIIHDAIKTGKLKSDQTIIEATAGNIRSQLTELGFDPTIYDNAISEIEELLAEEDIINLAKLLSKIYGCFCPEQYDNELNIDVHRTITAVEIDQQLHEYEDSLEDYRILCSFGTGGTSGGLSQYMDEKYGKKSIHVVFPLAGQEVGGIRTKAKADGLKLYNPDAYATQHEVDFGQAKHLFKFFVDKGHNIGESTALVLYKVLELVSDGDKGKFIVVVADGIEKYRKNLEAMSKNQRIQVSLDEAVSNVQDYDKIIWVHPQYTPKEAGIEMIAKSLGVDKEKITITKASTINQLLSTQQIPEELSKELDGSKGKSLLICMAGNTSLMTAQVLASKGIVTESLNGGITNLPEGIGKNSGEFIKAATE